MTERHSCPYCGSRILRARYLRCYHRVKLDHGPFDIFECRECGAALTLPPPSPEMLTDFYQSYSEWRPAVFKEISETDALSASYRGYVRQLSAAAARCEADAFSWIDVGAGGGEICRELMQRFPHSRGIAVDLSDRRPAIPKAVDWIGVDLNHDDFATAIGARADVVCSVAVWEHVRRPDAFLANLLRLLTPRGTLFIVCPDYGSWPRKLMRRRWPYFLPGEHLNIPTRKAALLCLRRELEALDRSAVARSISVRSTHLTYNLRYVFNTLGLGPLARAVPRDLALPLPVGALALSCTLEGSTTDLAALQGVVS